MIMFRFSRTKKSFLGILIAIFIFIQLFGMFAFSKPAQAQLVVSSPDVVAVQASKWSWEKVGKSLEAAALSALVQGASYFMRKLAYDAAMYVSSGGKGQGALAFNKGAGAYFKEVALDSAASAIDQFGKPFGLNLCQTPDIKLNVYLQIGLRSYYGDEKGGKGGPQQECKWQNMKDSWSSEAFEQKYGSGGSKFLSQTFSNAIRVEESDFGIALGAMAKIDRIKAAAETGAVTDRQEGSGFKPVTSLISNQIKTPAFLVQEETKSVTSKQSADMTASQIAGIYGSNSLQLFPMAASVFLNTLTSQLLKKLMSWSSGLFSESGSGGSDSGALSFYSQQAQNARQQAQETFGFLIASTVQRQLQSYEPVSEFASCPENPGLNNCVIDSGLQEAIQRGRGQRLTIAEALKDGLLHGDWPLISPKRVTDNSDVKGCFLRGYCYSNIQKLRKARVLPLGFELAALKANPNNLQDWTISKVINGFDDCAYNGGHAVADGQHPFCHLIDPNWIIKAPEAHCEALVKSSQLVSKDVAERQEVCVDVSTRIIEDENPEKLGYYSYCLKEKNIWQIGGISCEPQYNTCHTYSDRNGRDVSYLARTVDYGECNSESVGCRAYALEKNGEQWKNNTEIKTNILKDLGRPQTLFFNDKIKNYSCPDSADGCGAFFSALPNGQKGETIYLKKAPDYLGCYDIKIGSDSPEINWPQTAVDLLPLVDRSKECSNFSQVCLENEVGCEKYQPVDNGPAVPGIVGANECSEQCLGYDTYKQEETNFSPLAFPLYFIPNDGVSCQPQYAGCDEFTNIDALAKGGEALEYYTDLRYCERPTKDNQKIYYSWEGSANEGYVLQVHKLKPIDIAEEDYISEIFDNNPPAGFGQGSPAYVDDSLNKLNENNKLCNALNYNILINNPTSTEAANLDCRAFYDENGVIYYRLLKETMTVDVSCHPLRKTVSELSVDDSIPSTATDSKGNNLCEQKGGVIKDNVCNRCYRGGRLDDTKTACIYWTISTPSESVSCPAEANGCRSYIGNEGNNIEEILFNGETTASFEPYGESADALNQAMLGWSGIGVEVKVRPESIQVGQYSLGVKGKGQLSYTFASSTLSRNDWYELSFWARGDAQKLSAISFTQDGQRQGIFTINTATEEELSVPIGSAWQEYRLGLAQFTGDGREEIKLVFVNASASVNPQYYLDNIRLTRLPNHLSIIKDSWKTPEGYNVPLVCDSNPTDIFPGEALGCRAYTNSRNAQVNATGFEKLCRPEAVGCQALYDSYNTFTPLPEQDVSISGALAFNVWCKNDKGPPAGEAGKCALTYKDSRGEEKDPENCTVGGETGPPAGEAGKCVCSVPENGDGCYIDKIILPDGVDSLSKIKNAVMNPDTIFIPVDTPTSTPRYLTNRQEFNCSENNLGCQKMALENYVLAGGANASSSYEFSETYFLNDSEHYNATLCRQATLGCEQFQSGSDITFFKDPNIAGNALCAYLPLVENQSGEKSFGWFREGVGRCVQTGSLCRSQEDCEGDAIKNKCDLNSAVPCYPDYTQSDGGYGVWSNKSEYYDGFVGLCPAEKNGCAELVDTADKDSSGQNPADESGSAKGKPYYVIFSQELKNKAGECQGRVSLKEGCVLFDKTDQPNKIYNTKATYSASEETSPKYGFVPPATTGALDANTILKVERDRQCGEWLACKSSMTVWGDDNRPQEICHEMGICQKLGPANQCLQWEKSSMGADTYNPLPILNEDYYVSRDVSWYGEDYSGYSLLNQPEIGALSPIFFPAENQLFLGAMSKFESANLCGNKADGSLIPDGSLCGDGGRCYSKKCVYPLNGAFPNTVAVSGDTAKKLQEVKQYLEPATCKSHPELTSPYPDYLVVKEKSKVLGDVNKLFRYEFIVKNTEYANANVCQTGDCSCEYQKVEYKNGAKDYWPVTMLSRIASGICEDFGLKAGYPCNTDKDCGDDGLGRCSQKKSQETRYGQRGFCLEPDLSRPLGADQSGRKLYACLTWLPLNTAASIIDNYNYDERAGYLPALDAKDSPGEVYCTQGTKGMTYEKDKFEDLYKYIPKDYPFYNKKNNIGDYPEVYLDFRNVFGGAENFDSPFNWMTKYQEFNVTSKILYTYFQLWGWYEDFGGNEKKVYPNRTVLAVKSLNVLAGWKSKDEVNDGYMIGKDIFEQDLRRLYFVPFFYRKGGKGSSVLVNSVMIDLEQLRALFAAKLKKEMISDPLGQYVKDIRTVTVDKTNITYATFYGKLNDGRTRVGIIVDEEPGIKEIDFDNEIKYDITGESLDDSWIKNTRLGKAIDFDKDGKINKYDLLSNWGGFWFDDAYIEAANLAVIADLKPRCVEYASVYNSELGIGDTTNKAWTNRLWSKPESIKIKDVDKYDEFKSGTLFNGYKSYEDNFTVPFGALNWDTRKLLDSSAVEKRQYYFQDGAYDGYPFACTAKYWAEDIFSLTDYLSNNSCAGLKDYVLPTFTKTYDILINNELNLDQSLPTSQTGNKALRYLFAKAFNVVKRGTGSEYDFGNAIGWDYSADLGQNTAPDIYSLNPYNCFVDDKQACSVWKEDTITINRRNFLKDDYNNDKVKDEDVNHDQVLDPMIYFGGEANVNLNFFAVADDNHMPIRRVMVDWRDGVVLNEKRLGFYKNSKPFCEPSDIDAEPTLGRCSHTQITCQSDQDCGGLESPPYWTYNVCDKPPKIERYFGDSARACNNHYFEFAHYYTCSPENATVPVGILKDEEKKIILAHNKDTEKVCVFKPRVQVMDNWDFCNGACPGGDASDACYDDECNNFKTETGPWTYFNGNIIVAPEE